LRQLRKLEKLEVL
jgi:chromosome segregation ATPase